MSRNNTEFTTNENSQIIENENTQIIMKNESKMLNSPMISIENIEIIFHQMKTSVCEINNFLSKCTGFFCKIKIDDNKEIIVLITALHGIENSKKLILSNKEETMNINLDDSRVIYKDNNCDISIIEIKSSDKINKYSCLEIDEKYYKENDVHNYNNRPGYILGYPCEKECTFSFGKIKVIESKNKAYIQHFCSTIEGSSGSPIFMLDSLKCIGIHLKGGKYNNSGEFLFSSVNSFINKYKKSYSIINLEKIKFKNVQYNRNIFNNPKNIKIEVKEGSGYSNVETYNNPFVNKEINSFYSYLNKNKLDNLNIKDSSLNSSFTEIINNDIESFEDNNKIEIRNINCKSKMIDNYEIKENERLAKKKKIIKNENKKKMNSTPKSNLIPNNRIIKNDRKEKTFKHLVTSKKIYLNNLPNNSSNSNNKIFNTSNFDNNQVDHNVHINNLDKRIIKKNVKRFSATYDTNNNNINICIKNPLKNQIIINKINEIKNNIKKEKYDFLNIGKLSPRNYMINNNILEA